MPLPGTIVNPAKLAPNARNSICEQCHLKGVARVLNPGKKSEDFRPGEPLEEVFTTYRVAVPPGSPQENLRVISHVEQLALSLCARNSNGRLWCGTCHDPHDQSDQPPQYYRSRCLSCHKGTLPSSHPVGSNGDCVACHMSKRNAKDGGHTVFTDHRISSRPESEQKAATAGKGDLVPWRDPPSALRERNLAIAYVNGGFENHSASQIVQGLHMLTEVEKQLPDDPAVLTALGQALLAVNKPTEAAQRFERVLQLDPDSAVNEENAGTAWMQAGQMDKAIDHLERAIKRDPLLLPVAQALMQVYRQQDDADKAAALAERVRQALGSAAPRDSGSSEH